MLDEATVRSIAFTAGVTAGITAVAMLVVDAYLGHDLGPARSMAALAAGAALGA